MSNNINPFKSSLQQLYPTPILKHQFTDMDETNRNLHRLFIQKEKEHPDWRTGSSQRSNIGGWRSKEDLADWNDPDINHLVSRVGEAIGFLNQHRPIKDSPTRRNVDIYAWANINRQGQYNSSHIHPGFHWGAVYYVCCGDDNDDIPKSGQLEFQDPRPGAAAMPAPGYEFGHKFTVTPKSGLLVVFPAWLTHSVHPYQGQGERISIAFNIRLKP
ncbi:MAG: hypothetical protein AseanaTS_25740 [Candidatus Pelagadaptatus aseana]|uniref:2OG-Fe(II) oxygenase family protein n=1 Tax=Candidatus Pelagadaptatus aseana TaxID=3120508 RepID=UPI0039B24232